MPVSFLNCRAQLLRWQPAVVPPIFSRRCFYSVSHSLPGHFGQRAGRWESLHRTTVGLRNRLPVPLPADFPCASASRAQTSAMTRLDRTKDFLAADHTQIPVS